jgi:hypothetical protein
MFAIFQEKFIGFQKETERDASFLAPGGMAVTGRPPNKITFSGNPFMVMQGALQNPALFNLNMLVIGQLGTGLEAE